MNFFQKQQQQKKKKKQKSKYNTVLSTLQCLPDIFFPSVASSTVENLVYCYPASTPSSEVSLGKKISQKFYCPVTPFVPVMFPAAASDCQSLAKGMQMPAHFTEFRHLISCLKR